MRSLVWKKMVALVLLIGIAAAYGPAVAGEKGICVVCQVKEGASHPEDVAAVRTHDGVRYTFCTEKCAEEFDADPAAFVAPALPRPAPALAMADLSGKPLNWETFKGKVVLVDFWATWCSPCRKSMPELQVLHEKYAPRGFAVLGVSIDEGGSEKVQKLVRSKKFTYPMALDSETEPTWEKFRVKAIPAAFLVDRQGQVVAQWTGKPVDVQEVEEKLASLLASD